MKPNYRYQMDFDGKAARWSVICMAASFFFTMAAYFGFTNLADCNFLEVLFLMIMPALICGAYVFLMKIRQLNAPGIYGILGAALCLAVTIGCFFSGNVIRILLGLVWYAACAVMLLACVGGYISANSLVVFMFGTAIAVRVLFFPVRINNPILLCKELSVIMALSSLMLLPLSLKAGKH